MKQYNKPMMDIISLRSQDVIVTSDKGDNKDPWADPTSTNFPGAQN